MANPPFTLHQKVDALFRRTESDHCQDCHGTLQLLGAADPAQPGTSKYELLCSRVEASTAHLSELKVELAKVVSEVAEPSGIRPGDSLREIIATEPFSPADRQVLRELSDALAKIGGIPSPISLTSTDEGFDEDDRAALLWCRDTARGYGG